MKSFTQFLSEERKNEISWVHSKEHGFTHTQGYLRHYNIAMNHPTEYHEREHKGAAIVDHKNKHMKILTYDSEVQPEHVEHARKALNVPKHYSTVYLNRPS